MSGLGTGYARRVRLRIVTTAFIEEGKKMTDRYNAITVVLERDTRDDDAAALLNAIRQLRGVLSVSGNVANLDSHIAQERARHSLGEELWHVLYPKSGG
jgi:hypothetical protein